MWIVDSTLNGRKTPAARAHGLEIMLFARMRPVRTDPQRAALA